MKRIANRFDYPTGGGAIPGRCVTGAAGAEAAGACPSSHAPAVDAVHPTQKQFSASPEVWDAANALPPISRKPSPFSEACEAIRSKIMAGIPIEEITLDDTTLPLASCNTQHTQIEPDSEAQRVKPFWLLSDTGHLTIGAGDEMIQLSPPEVRRLARVLASGVL